jgi:hypothetical protein
MGALCSGKAENPPSIAGGKANNNGRVVAGAPKGVYTIERRDSGPINISDKG